MSTPTEAGGMVVRSNEALTAAGSESHSQKHSNSTTPVAQGTSGGKRGGGGTMASSDRLRTFRHSAKGVVRGRGIAAAVSASVLVALVAAVALL